MLLPAEQTEALKKAQALILKAANHLYNIPTEILWLVLTFLETKELLTFAKTSRCNRNQYCI